jgi:hypothetical protein
MTLKYCPSCKRNVQTNYDWNVLVLVILLFLGLIPGLIYVVWKVIKGRSCPICRIPEGMMDNPKFDTDASDKDKKE